MHARYYTFNLGRFMSVDPVGGEVGLSQSWNRYAYVRGNPVNATDPDGRFTFWDVADIGFAAKSIGTLWRKALSGEQITAADNFNAIADSVALLPIVPSLGMVREGGKFIERAEDAVDAVRAADKAHDTAEGVRLQKGLASEQQVGEILSGEAKSIAGAGADAQLRDAGRLAKKYGGKAEDWAKVRSGSFTAKDGTKFEIHAYRNTKTGKTVELKTKIVELERLAEQAGGGP